MSYRPAKQHPVRKQDMLPIHPLPPWTDPSTLLQGQRGERISGPFRLRISKSVAGIVSDLSHSVSALWFVAQVKGLFYF